MSNFGTLSIKRRQNQPRRDKQKIKRASLESSVMTHSNKDTAWRKSRPYSRKVHDNWQRLCWTLFCPHAVAEMRPLCVHSCEFFRDEWQDLVWWGKQVMMISGEHVHKENLIKTAKRSSCSWTSSSQMPTTLKGYRIRKMLSIDRQTEGGSETERERESEREVKWAVINPFGARMCQYRVYSAKTNMLSFSFTNIQMQSAWLLHAFRQQNDND